MYARAVLGYIFVLLLVAAGQVRGGASIQLQMASGITTVALDDLTDVTITGAAQNQVLARNATTWVNATGNASGDVNFTVAANTITFLFVAGVTGSNNIVKSDSPTFGGTPNFSAGKFKIADAAANPTIVGEVFRNGADIKFHDGTAARTLLTDQFRIVIQTPANATTYTPTANTLYAIIESIGGGAGGGGCAGTAGNNLAGGGGGGGGYSRVVVSAAQLAAAAPITVTRGAGGAGGLAGANAGSPGGDSSVGALCVAKGGAGGDGSSTANIPTGGRGGLAGTGDVTLTGPRGGSGINATITTFAMAGGNGASSVLGGTGGSGAAAAFGTAAPGSSATGEGAGGGAGEALNTNTNAAGGAGSAGINIITEFVRK